MGLTIIGLVFAVGCITIVMALMSIRDAIIYSCSLQKKHIELGKEAIEITKKLHKQILENEKNDSARQPD